MAIVESDPVLLPEHYTQGSIECVDAMYSALGKDGFVSYCKGNSLKYLWRAGLKGSLEQDLRKASTYIRFACNVLEGRMPKEDRTSLS